MSDTTAKEFRTRFVAALKEDPPSLLNNSFTAESGGWLLRHFSLEELETLASEEDRLGEEVLNKFILDAFVEAGLPRPTYARHGTEKNGSEREEP